MTTNRSRGKGLRHDAASGEDEVMAYDEVITDGAPKPSGAYSQAISAHGFLFVAGIGPYDPLTRLIVGNTIEDQTVQVMRNIRGVLRSRELSFRDIVNSTVYLASLDRDFVGFDVTYSSFFEPPFPARATTGAVLKNILVEIAVVAAFRS
jgi:2-iminobutanoate/2-iminopropanoate deaminase